MGITALERSTIFVFTIILKYNKYWLLLHSNRFFYCKILDHPAFFNYYYQLLPTAASC